MDDYVVLLDESIYSLPYKIAQRSQETNIKCTTPTLMYTITIRNCECELLIRLMTLSKDIVMISASLRGIESINGKTELRTLKLNNLDFQDKNKNLRKSSLSLRIKNALLYPLFQLESLILENLPTNILNLITSFLSWNDVISFSQSNRLFHDLMNQDIVWNNLLNRDILSKSSMKTEYDNILSDTTQSSKDKYKTIIIHQNQQRRQRYTRQYQQHYAFTMIDPTYFVDNDDLLLLPSLCRRPVSTVTNPSELRLSRLPEYSLPTPHHNNNSHNNDDILWHPPHIDDGLSLPFERPFSY